jgi:ABC-type nickel/cobalt efflux system permease component RcnA
MFGHSLNIFLLSSFWVGFLHALEIDHLAAIGNLVDPNNIKKSIIEGVKWGIGHSIIVVIAGLLLIFFKVQVSEQFSHFFEIGVGVMLIVIAIMSLKHTLLPTDNSHKHYINGEWVMHNHVNNNKSILVGIVHGLAGSSSFVLLLLPFIKDKIEAIYYLGNFVLGTVVGMGVMAFLVVIPFRFGGDSSRGINKLIRVLMGIIGLIVGLNVLISNW